MQAKRTSKARLCLQLSQQYEINDMRRTFVATCLTSNTACSLDALGREASPTYDKLNKGTAMQQHFRQRYYASNSC